MASTKTESLILTSALEIPRRMPVGDYRKVSFWADVTPEEWEDWRWQIRNRITSSDEISKILVLTPQEEEGIKKSRGRLSMAITPYWVTLMDANDPECPIRRQAIPTHEEFQYGPNEFVDPCAEDRDAPVHGLVHRYPDRVLLMSTEQCAMYCRHCTRRRLVGGKEIRALDAKTIDAAVEYIRSNKKIRDVLISGGDPLMLEDEELESIRQKVTSIPHVEFVRLGTRVPVTLPQRVTPELVAMLKKYGPLWISIHFNHPKEISKRCKAACDMLADAGFPLGSQTVLLRGINDKPYVMKKLMHDLLKIRVRPYYIYQCDPVKGTAHFRTPIAVGINIIDKLRGFTSGYAVPTYVVDAPGGGGKIPVGPNYLISQDKGKHVLRNFRGKIYTYIE
jgi:lysine 2,3-aminomutase